MIEEDLTVLDKHIKRIEKKVDLLYKMHLEKTDDGIGLRCFSDELIPLFNISVGTKLFIKLEELMKVVVVEFKKAEEVENKLNNLENDYETGNFLANERDKILLMVDNQRKKYKALVKMAEHVKGIEYDKKRLCEEFLLLNLKEKLVMSLSENDIEHKKRLEEEFKEVINRLRLRLMEYKKL